MTRRRVRAPKAQRVAAYAVIVRGDAEGGSILLSRLSEAVTPGVLWTLPGGGVDHGEDPRAAVVREIAEETGLDAEVGETAHVFSHHQPRARRDGRLVDAHAVRIVFDGWVPRDAPDPHTVEVGGSTAEAAWVPLADVHSGTVPTVPLVRDALAAYRPVHLQRLAAYALVLRDEEILLTRISPLGFHAGSWTLPGGGIDFGEHPRTALEREVREECGLACEVGGVLAVDDVRVTGAAPSGRNEEFHGIHLVFEATVAPGAVPRVTEAAGTTDAAAWVPLATLDELPVLDVVRVALAARLNG